MKTAAWVNPCGGLFWSRSIRLLFVYAERRDGQTAEGIDRDAVFTRLNVFEDDEVGTASESARGEGLPFQRVALPVAESSDRCVFGDSHLLFDFEPEDADGRHRIEAVVRNAHDESDTVALFEPGISPRAFERHFVDMLLADAEQFLPGGRTVAGRQTLLGELFGRIVDADGQALADEFGLGKFQGLCKGATEEQSEEGRAEKFFQEKKVFSLANIKIACSYDNFFCNFSDRMGNKNPPGHSAGRIWQGVIVAGN